VIVSRDGDQQMLQSVIDRLHAQIRLYINDHRPKYTDTINDYVELDGHGYLPITLGPDDWRIEHDRQGRIFAEARAAVWTFDEGPPQRVYGYYATNETTRQWVFADRLVTEEPLILQNQGERLRVICRLRSPFSTTALRIRKG
jgi:hypothetical protein